MSARAKRPRLVVTADQRLVVVIPKRFPKKDVPSLIESHREWLAHTSSGIKAIRESVGLEILAEQERRLPRAIYLRCVGEERTVEYRESDMVRVEFCERGDSILLSGRVSDESLCREALRRWLREKAEQHLWPLLHDIGLELGLGFKKAAIRSQRSRWASYSPTGTVSLNVKMMFLPPGLVRHVLVHELCHSVHLNHSRDFWALLAQRDPDYREHAAELKTAFKYVPKWVEMDRG